MFQTHLTLKSERVQLNSLSELVAYRVSAVRVLAPHLFPFIGRVNRNAGIRVHISQLLYVVISRQSIVIYGRPLCEREAPRPISLFKCKSRQAVDGGRWAVVGAEGPLPFELM